MPSSTYIWAAAMQKIMDKYIKNYQSHVASYGSDSVFPELFLSKTLEMGMVTSSIGYKAVYSQSAWAGKPSRPVRIIANGPVGAWGLSIVSPNSGIKTPADVVGKKWMAIRAGSADLQEAVDMVLYAYGIDKSKVTMLPYTTNTELTEALSGGKVDAIHSVFYQATPWVQELLATKKGILISDTEEAIKKVTDKLPYMVRLVIPAGSYPGQDKDIVTFGQANTLGCRADLPADQVYEITAALFDHFKELLTFGSADMASFQPPGSILPSAISYPFHDGAIKYYKEKGLWTPAHEAKQQQLLKALPK